MKFGLFMYCTVGRKRELEAGMAGRKPELYHRMLDEIGAYASFADANGYHAFGHPEHHLQIEGFELSNDPCLMAMWLAKRRRRSPRSIICWADASASAWCGVTRPAGWRTTKSSLS